MLLRVLLKVSPNNKVPFTHPFEAGNPTSTSCQLEVFSGFIDGLNSGKATKGVELVQLCFIIYVQIVVSQS